MNSIDVSNQQTELDRIEQELTRAETATNPALLRKLSRQHAHLKEIVSTAQILEETIKRITESREIIESGDCDEELIELAQEEIDQAGAQAEQGIQGETGAAGPSATCPSRCPPTSASSRLGVASRLLPCSSPADSA